MKNEIKNLAEIREEIAALEEMAWKIANRLSSIKSELAILEFKDASNKEKS